MAPGSGRVSTLRVLCDMKDGETVVEDVKGYTRANSQPYRLFVVKRKLMLWVHGIAVREI